MAELIKNINKLPKNISIGNKAKSLQYIAQKKLSIPKTYVVLHSAQNQFISAPEITQRILLKDLEGIIDPQKKYAVRSSAEIEDQDDFSFAGQFNTQLNIQGTKNILSSIIEVWNSGKKTKLSSYAKGVKKTNGNHSISVMVQEMVKPLWSGVAFSINPVNGKSETVIEAVRGTGDRLVQSGETPFRWIFAQGNWEINEQKDTPGLELLNTLVEDIKRIKKRNEIDVEWAFDGKTLYYLQLRSVTSIKFPTIYSNHISREFLPGMIKPLVWSVNIPLVNGAWIRLLTQLVGKTDIEPEQLSKSFHYRAYFNMGTMGAIFTMMGLPKKSLESLMGRKDPSGQSSFKPSLKTFLLLPRILWFIISNLNISKRFEMDIIDLRKKSKSLENAIEQDFKIEKFDFYYQQLFELGSELAYYNIIIPLLMQFTSRIFRNSLKKNGLEYSDEFFYQMYPDLKSYSPQTDIEELQSQWKLFNKEQKELITKKLTGEIEESIESDFENMFEEFLENFGHHSESGNDFSSPKWKEQKDFVLNVLIENTTLNEDKNAQTSKGKISEIREKRKLFRKAKRAGKFRLKREIISSEYIRGYGLFRPLFLKVAEFLKRKGIINELEDIFYLKVDEIKSLLEEKQFNNVQEIIDNIKSDMANVKDIVLPSIIYGEIPPLAPKKNEKILEGIPISSGYFEGEIVVVRGYQDFNKTIEGRALVIPFSDVSWTPILTKAGAILSESGGVLSHASIIARELGIPAIASVDHACNLMDGTKVKLDCNHGRIIIQEK